MPCYFSLLLRSSCTSHRIPLVRRFHPTPPLTVRRPPTHKPPTDKKPSSKPRVLRYFGGWTFATSSPLSLSGIQGTGVERGGCTPVGSGDGGSEKGEPVAGGWGGWGGGERAVDEVFLEVVAIMLYMVT